MVDDAGNFAIAGPNGAIYNDVAAAQKAAVSEKTIVVDSKGNALVGDWPSTKNLTAPENALDHWKKHSIEFPEFTNPGQYVAAAQQFVTSPPVGTLSIIRSNGDRVFYNPLSNTFAVKGIDGAPKTMFRPDPAQHGYTTNLEYFYAQKK